MLKYIVATKLKRKWSPKQIAGWLKRTYPFEAHKQVSHETIYRSTWCAKKELQQYLRTQRAIRRARQHSIKSEGLGKITNAVSIRERPASDEHRAVPGHWEGNFISGSNNTHIATLVERHSRYAILVKVKGKDTETVISALIKHAKKLPTELYKSLTWDRGKEAQMKILIDSLDNIFLKGQIYRHTHK